MPMVLARNWWALALRGATAVIFGALAFIWPAITLVVLVYLFGAYVMVDGVFAIITALRAPAGHARWMSMLLEGLIGVGVGTVTFVWPGVATVALLWLIAAWAIVTGVFEIIAAVRLRKAITGEWLMVLSGAISVLFGLALVVMPVVGALAVTWLIGIYAVVFGVLLLGLAFRLRRWSTSGIGRQTPTPV